MPPPFRRITIGLLAVILAALPGCESSTPPRLITEKLTGEPIVRVRVRRSADSVTFINPTRLQVYPVGLPDQKHLLTTPVTIRRAGGAWSGPWTGRAPGPGAVLAVEPLGPAHLSISQNRYPGTIRLVPDAGAPERFDAVNHVRLEAYLPGVLDRELYDHWKPAAYLAQAIAARSYAIDRIIQGGRTRHYDMESTQASQAYSGYTAHSLSARAVADTAGLVLTYRGRIIPAYYSSTCGGIGQSAADAFGSPNPTSIPPLTPKSRRSWCVGTRHYEWGPVERDRQLLSRRIALWGRRTDRPIADLGEVRSIRISGTNHLGRPVRFEIADDRGQTYTLRADTLRHACNYSDSDAGLDPPGENLRSGFFEVETRGDKIVFVRGHGFGHGVGLCQYGAEGMARAGYEPLQILAEYYPGARVERAY